MKDRDILDSWKEIAVYLNRGIKTCQRWEKDYQLPVHRLDGSPKASVFAFKHELDDWLQETLRQKEQSPDKSRVGSGLKTKEFHRSIVGIVGLLSITAVFWRLFLAPSGSHPSKPPSIAQPQPFITAENVLYENPAWSPLGNLIAFNSNRAGTQDIWICDPGGSNPINLTADSEGEDRDPAWSPDGLRIAFLSTRENPGLYTMSSTGGEVRRVVDIRSPGWFDLTWSRDNRLIYCDRHEEGRLNVFAVSPSGADRRCLTNDLGGRRQGELSPLGDLLVCRDDYNSNSVIDILHLPSGKIESLTKEGVRPHWSPKGDEIFFLSAEEGFQNLWSVKVDPETGRQIGEPVIRTLTLNLSDFALSPDSRTALITRFTSRQNIWNLPLNANGIPDLKNALRLTSGNFSDEFPWFITGKGEVCFLSNRRGTVDVWKISVEHPQSNPVRLTSGEDEFRNITASPDGRWIAASSNKVWLMRTDGSEYHELDIFGDEVAGIYVDDWSRDGRYISFSFMKKGEDVLRVGCAAIDAEKGQTLEFVQIGINREENSRIGHTSTFSPDGRFLCYQSPEAGNFDIWIASIDGRDVHQLTTGSGDERSPLWTEDPSYIYYFITRGEKKPGIYRVPMGEEGYPIGEPEFCFNVREGVRTWWTYKGQSFLSERAFFSVYEGESDIWLVRLNGRAP